MEWEVVCVGVNACGYKLDTGGVGCGRLSWLMQIIEVLDDNASGDINEALRVHTQRADLLALGSSAVDVATRALRVRGTQESKQNDIVFNIKQTNK